MAPQTGTTLHLPEAALYRLGLTAQPFVGIPDPPFEDSARITQINVTLSLLQSGERIVLISGDAGLGKTTLLRRLAESQPPGLSMQRVQGDGADIDTLWGALVAAAEAEEGTLAPRSREQALNYVRSARRGGVRPALLIDDAHALPAREIDELLGLWTELAEDDEAFSLAMALEPAGLQSLPETPPAERFHTTTLYPLSQEQTGAYLDHRTRSAGAEHTLFDPHEIADIFRQSGGHPERINEAAYRRLTARLASSDQPAPKPGPRPAKSPGLRGTGLRWALAGVTGITAASAGTYWLLTHQLSTGPATEELAIEDFEEPEEETVAAESEEIEPASDTPFGLDLPGRYSFRDSPDEQEPPSPTGQSTTNLQLLDTPDAAQGPTDSGPTEGEPGTETAEEDLADSADWIRGEDGERYTIQLLAASEPAPLQEYAGQQPLDEPTHVVATERDDGDLWFLLLHGSHEDREAAHAALDALPEAVAERGAWVRSFESVAESLAAED
ncbi:MULTISPECIES: AAA family ATPase [Halorhodospira]|uniref:AAA family ATPase n=1 Tax=Halorhodospira TaxID=85108 RepID=UPI001EE84640|nr:MULTISPECIES: AAA family ATPase [Halorhodospira]MCG5528214.1 AAA family ATPase [Halorhodospira halophila]MCG5543871.1 AAA family ATPase [Halorhodospira sp. 9628]